MASEERVIVYRAILILLVTENWKHQNKRDVGLFRGKYTFENSRQLLSAHKHIHCTSQAT